MQLSINNLSVKRNNILLWQNLSLKITSGELVIITGDNAVGKSSLLRVIAGLLRPYSGNIILTEQEKKLNLAANCHYLSEKSALKSILTLKENINFWQNILNIKTKLCQNKLNEILQKLKLAELANEKVSRFSSGQKKRAALARFLLEYRAIWLLDEAFLHLDNKSSLILQDILQHHLDNSGIIFLISHLKLNLQADHTIHLNDYV